ncbi:MAG: radical SAM protein [Clostridia bacterium]
MTKGVNMYTLPKNEYRISITSACNMKCIYCHNEGNTNISSLSKDDIDLLLKNSYDIGLKSVRITGGEPTLHKQLAEICDLIKNKYHLQVGLNTNAIEKDKIVYLAKKKLIDRIVVGIDYFDAIVSKNSPIGEKSTKILSNILEIKKYCPDTAISCVYDGNLDNIDKMVNWALTNHIRIKILEIVGKEFAEASTKVYIDMRDYISKKYNLDLQTSEKYYYQLQGFINGERVVSFFHSIHRLHQCDLCKKMHIRITSDGKFNGCMFLNYKRTDFRIGNVRQNILDYFEYHFNIKSKSIEKEIN